MPSFGSLGKFFGRTVGEGAAFAAGAAVAPALRPVVQEVENEAWTKYQTRPLGLGDLADIVAENVEAKPWGETEAKKTGFSPGNFDALLGAALNAPGVGELFEAWRRDLIDDAAFEHGLRKAKLETRWDAPLKALKDELLSPEDLARMIQRGLIPDPGILPVGPPSGAGNVPAFPVFDIDADKEAAGSGITHERLAALTGLVGNPMGAHEAAQAEFRGILTADDYRRAIAEGNTRNEWADAIREQSRAIPSVTNYVEAYVRGWITHDQMTAGAARHGMTADDAELAFLIHGRPLSWHQVFIGLRRGGVYDGPTGGIDPAFLKALRESNIRPEWYNLAWAQRFTYPAAFVLRTLVQGGDLTAAEGEQILLYEGWEPNLAKTVSAKWAQAPSAAAKEASAADLLALYDGEKATLAETLTALEALGYPADEARAKVDVLAARRVSAARNTTISDLHGAFKKTELTAAEVTAALAKLVPDAESVAHIVAAWQVYRDAFPTTTTTTP